MNGSNLNVVRQADNLVLSSDQYDVNKTIAINDLMFNQPYDTEIVLPEAEFYHLHYLGEIEYTGQKCWISVFTEKGSTKCMLSSGYKVVKTFLQFEGTAITASLSTKGLTVKWAGGITNKFALDVTDTSFSVDNIGHTSFEMPVSRKKLKKEDFGKRTFQRTLFIPMNLLIHDDTVVNQRCMIRFQLEQATISYPISMKDESITSTKEYYVPLSRIQIDDWVMYLRRTLNGSLTLVRRPVEEIEKSRQFQIMESDMVSRKMYEAGERKREKGKEKVVLFYEKFASKAEEGTFELFLKALDYNPNCYYIIAKDSPDYERIHTYKNVVVKFSREYYNLLYSASVLIGTEAPQHIHIVRGSNPFIKRVLHDVVFIFLQHGVMFCTDISKSTILSKGKEFEPDYICINSKKEERGIDISLQLPVEKMIRCGTPVFDTLEYKHINQESEDKVLLMLTWRPDDASLTNFEESYNYKKTKEIFDLLKQYISTDKIMVISHPMITDKMSQTSLAPNLYTKPMSQALRETKLLITDFSSIAYNVFYQGAAVLFHQEPAYVDRDLIPEDDEWIGYRSFSMADLQTYLEKGIIDERVQLGYLRNSQFEETYHSINEFSDGKNAERLIEFLTEKNII